MHPMNTMPVWRGIEDDGPPIVWEPVDGIMGMRLTEMLQSLNEAFDLVDDAATPEAA